MYIKKGLFSLMVLTILTLAVCFCGMIFVANFQQGTISEYDKLTSQQQKDYEELAERYIDLSSHDWQLQMEYDLLVEHYETAVQLPTYEYTMDDIILLAKVAQTETGTPTRSPTAFRYAVKVVLNRVESTEFPNTVYDVVYQERAGAPQFSVTQNGALDSCDLKPESISAVYEVLLFGTDLPAYVEYFFEENVTGNWVNTLPVYTTVDGTTFAYSERSMRK